MLVILTVKYKKKLNRENYIKKLELYPKTKQNQYRFVELYFPKTEKNTVVIVSNYEKKMMKFGVRSVIRKN